MEYSDERIEDFIYEAEEPEERSQRIRLKWKPRGGRGSNPTVAAMRSERQNIELQLEAEFHRRLEEYAS